MYEMNVTTISIMALYLETYVSEIYNAYTFIPEDGSSMILRNICYLPTRPHDVTTHMTTSDMFTENTTSLHEVTHLTHIRGTLGSSLSPEYRQNIFAFLSRSTYLK